MRECSKCGQVKTLTDFVKDKRCKDGRTRCCKECKQKANDVRYPNGEMQEKSLNARHKRLYGITTKEYKNLMVEAGSSCPLCGSTYGESRSKHGKVLDHCHKSGKIRGVICNNCNTTLGKINDNVETLKRMINYLK